MATWRPGAREGCALGLLFVVAVAAWKIAGSSYFDDLAALCDGERLSGLSMRRDMGGVTEWIRGRLVTPRGNRLFSELRDLPMGLRGGRLRAEAEAAGVRSCPMAGTYDELAWEAEYRSDIQRICSYATFPGLAGLDDAARVWALVEWIRETSTNERTLRLEDRLRAAGTSAEAAKALRDAASEIDVFTCDTSGVLAAPAAPFCGSAAAAGGG